MREGIRTRSTRNSSSLESVAIPPSPLSPASVSIAGRTRSARAAPTMDGSQSMLTPPPSFAQPDLAARLNAFSIVSPIASEFDKDVEATSMPSPPLQERSFFAQNRAILLAGLPSASSQAAFAKTNPPMDSRNNTSTSTSTSSNSSSDGKLPSRRLTPLVTTRNSAEDKRFFGRSFSPVESPRVISPCVYVRATSLKQQKAVSPGAALSEGGDGRDDADSTDDDSELPLRDRQLHICAFVRPSSADEKPYAIQRIVDREALALAVPRPDAQASGSISIVPSHVSRSPLSALPSINANILSPVSGIKRRASPSPPSPASPHPSLRRHSRQSGQKEPPSPAQFATAGGIPIPIRPHPALGTLPGLAAVILSGHIQPGDTIEQPLPHPEAWPQTVSYAYRASNEITEAVRKNIEHLGGKVE